MQLAGLLAWRVRELARHVSSYACVHWQAGFEIVAARRSIREVRSSFRRWPLGEGATTSNVSYDPVIVSIT